MNSCGNSPEDGPVGPKHVEIRQYINKIEIVTSVGFYSICWKDARYKKLKIWPFLFSAEVNEWSLTFTAAIRHHNMDRDHFWSCSIRLSEPPWPQLAVFVRIADSGMAGVTTPLAGRQSCHHSARGTQFVRGAVSLRHWRTKQKDALASKWGYFSLFLRLDSW